MPPGHLARLARLARLSCLARLGRLDRLARLDRFRRLDRLDRLDGLTTCVQNSGKNILLFRWTQNLDPKVTYQNR